MDIRPRMKYLALCVAAAAAQLVATTVCADSGVGVDTVLGNALNPSGVSTARDRDPDGLGEAQHSRSPSGFLNADPYLIKTPGKTESGWLYTGSAEIGVIGVGGDKKAAKFREYKDLDNGLYLNNFGLQMENPSGAYFVDALSGGVGQTDQYYGLSFGRYNGWKVKTFYNESGHVFSSTYRNLWSGAGTGNLTLNGLPAGPLAPATAATTDIAIGNVALATPYSELSIVRKKGGVRLDMILPREWKFFASYSNEKREGTRPFGLVIGGGGGTGAVEIPESIDYNTHDFLAGLQLADTLSSVNLQVSGSLFRNNTGTMSVEDPMFLAAANGIAAFPRAVFDLYPNNDFFNVKGEYARAFPDFYKGRFTGVVSLSRSRQNDSLIPSTSYAGANVNGVAGGAWDTTASLSKQSAGAQIDTNLIDLGLALNPVNDLDVKSKIRYYETKNSTEYWACNPLNGQWGRLTNDGSGAAMVNTPAYLAGNIRCNATATAALGVVPSAGNVNIRNIPYEYKQYIYTLGADYRLGKANSFNASYEREAFDRQHRERAETWEDKLKIGYVNRSFEGGTIRLSAENDRRRGSTYIPDPYDEFYSASLGPLPTAAATNGTAWIHVIDQFRKFDLADRDQNLLNARFNYSLASDLDGGVSLQMKDIRYPGSDYGRNGHQKQDSLNFDLNWQPSSKMSVYGFYSYQSAQMQQRGIQQNACVIGTTYSFWSNGVVNTGAAVAGATLVATTAVTAANFLSVCGTASPTSPLYPESRAWNSTQNDRNDVLGLGLRYDFGKAKLDLNYTYTNGRTGIRYGYNADALALTATQAALAGDGFTDLTYTQNVIDASLLVPISKTTSLRLIYRYEIGKIRDWHYDGVAANPTPSNNMQTYLDSGPQDYKASLIGILLKIDL